jgi:hypothetical protein
MYDTSWRVLPINRDGQTGQTGREGDGGIEIGTETETETRRRSARERIWIGGAVHKMDDT